MTFHLRTPSPNITIIAACTVFVALAVTFGISRQDSDAGQPTALQATVHAVQATVPANMDPAPVPTTTPSANLSTATAPVPTAGMLGANGPTTAMWFLSFPASASTTLTRWNGFTATSDGSHTWFGHLTAPSGWTTSSGDYGPACEHDCQLTDGARYTTATLVAISAGDPTTHTNSGCDLYVLSRTWDNGAGYSGNATINRYTGPSSDPTGLLNGDHATVTCPAT